MSTSTKGLDDSFVFRKPRFQVIGCGGAGCNSVNRFVQLGAGDISTVVVNTDKMHLDRVKAKYKFLLGEGITKGYGTGGNPEVAERAALLQDKELKELVGHYDLSFITVGLGGGTGTGAAPYLARLARESGSTVVSLVTMPFKVEKGRQKVALAGLEKLRQVSDSVVVLDNNRLIKIVPKLPVEQAFAVMDQLITEVVRNVAGMINVPGLINLDFADLRAVFQGGGMSTVLYGENSAYDPEKVVSDTLNNPLLDVDVTGARGALVHIASGSNLRLGTAYQVIEGLTRELPEDAQVKFGVRFDQDSQGVIKVMCIMTGLQVPTFLKPPGEVVKVVGGDSNVDSQSTSFLRR